MLRRTKNQILNGKPLLQLPERILNLVECCFNATEKEFYRLLENRMTSEVNKLVQSDHVNYTHVLVLLLRLRQGERLVQLDQRTGVIKRVEYQPATIPHLFPRIIASTKMQPSPRPLKMTKTTQKTSRLCSDSWECPVRSSVSSARLRPLFHCTLSTSSSFCLLQPASGRRCNTLQRMPKSCQNYRAYIELKPSSRVCQNQQNLGYFEDD